MTSRQHILSLLAVLLMAAPGLAAPTHSGTWTASVKETQLQLSLRMKGDQGGHMGMPVPLTAFQGLSTADGSNAPFRMTREAGTFAFEGRFSGGEGAGHFQFEPSESYARSMAGLGYPKLSPEDHFKLALFDITTTRIKDLGALGYKDIPLEDLFEVGIFQVTPEFIREIRGMGFSSISQDDLLAFRIHGVTPEFIREIRDMGYPNATADDLVKLRIHGIDSNFMRSLSGGKRGGDARKKP